jgi:hypothetical protein
MKGKIQLPIPKNKAYCEVLFSVGKGNNTLMTITKNLYFFATEKKVRYATGNVYNKLNILVKQKFLVREEVSGQQIYSVNYGKTVTEFKKYLKYSGVDFDEITSTEAGVIYSLEEIISTIKTFIKESDTFKIKTLEDLYQLIFWEVKRRTLAGLKGY